MEVSSIIIPFTIFFLGTEAAKILLISMPVSDSHRRSLYPIARELGIKGHNVTLLMEGIHDVTKQPDPLESESIENKIIYAKMPGYLSEAESIIEWLTWKTLHSRPLWVSWSLFTEVSLQILQHNRSEIDKIQKIDWDFIMVDAYFTTGAMSLAMTTYRQYSPFYTSTISSTDSFEVPIPRPFSYIPTMFLSTESINYDHRSFWSRLDSTFTDCLEMITKLLIDLLDLRIKFSHINPDLSFHEFNKKQKASYVVFPQILDIAKPTVFNLINVGDDCPNDNVNKTLDQEMIKFIDDPESKGTIVVAFGHMVKWNQAPKEVAENFAESLNQFTNYRIVWQFDLDPTEFNLGDHVKVMKWIPQIALLNHPKTQLFISHAGLKSIVESICSETPILLIPFFAEQARNSYLLKKKGVGLILSKSQLTVTSLVHKISKMLSKNTFSDRISKLRQMQDDKIRKSLNLGVFWTEFHIRHSSIDKKWFKLKYQSWFQYLMFDFLILCLSILIIGSTVLCKIYRKMSYLMQTN